MPDWNPENMAHLTPYLIMRDAEAAAEFYASAFGFEQREVVPGKDGRPMHIGMAYRGKSIVMFASGEGHEGDSASPAETGAVCPASFYVYCENADQLIARAVAAGAKKTMELENMFWGDRIGQVQDPDGYRWTFATVVSPMRSAVDSPDSKTNPNRKAEYPRQIADCVAGFLKDGDLEGVVSMFHPECRIFFPPNEPPKIGKEGAREIFAEFIEMRPTLISTITSEVIVGDTALLQAVWRFEDANGTIIAEGNSTEVAKMQPDGGWRYYIDCPLGMPQISP